ncbi:MAG: Peptidase M23 [Candidatus Magasanikbacteria bacterium GW2011_GWA2_37_8]|uniref:Peptidase M23 n=1 Tax=Candidatus Magasanikbacteria bacterium GW2011_GWA2_37_8 TaxID=1619036 RepID=A0A0G0KKS7_9BACT|nr:MAG: Peptidase M23 [Candidatus Magasanikbacteria bacterium GW2011_GWA2_37_8]
MKTKYLIIVGLLVISLILGASFAFAENSTIEDVTTLNKEIAARKEKIKQLEENIAKFQKTVDQKRLEAVSLKNQMSILDNYVAKAETDVQLTTEKVKEIELEIEALNLSIKDKTTIIEKQKIIISKIVQNLHANDQKNYLEIMLTNDSFADFYNQAKYLENVYTDLGRSVKSVRLAKEDLDNKKVQAESRRKTYNDLLTQLENKKQDLTDQQGIKQNLLVQTQSEELRYRTLLATQKQQYQAIEGELRAYEDKVRKKLEQQDKISSGDISLSWPTPSHYITASFNDKDYPFRNIFEHNAIDIRAGQGTPIKAAGAGYVARAKRCSLASCYSYVLIVHTDNLSTVYGHLSSINVTEDQFVNRGDVIGYSGGTPGTVGAGPFVTGAHLHFEVRKNGIPVDPMGYLIN